MPTQILDEAECLQLLATQTVGRLAVVIADYPRVLPVNYALDEGVVVFRSGAGAKLQAAQYRNVAFQVDDIDHLNRSGWSVLVTGRAEVLGDRHGEELLSRVRALDVQPYEGGDKPSWVRIVATSVTGRRVGPERVLYFDLPSEAYL